MLRKTDFKTIFVKHFARKSSGRNEAGMIHENGRLYFSYGCKESRESG